MCLHPSTCWGGVEPHPFTGETEGEDREGGREGGWEGERERKRMMSMVLGLGEGRSQSSSLSTDKSFYNTTIAISHSQSLSDYMDVVCR